MVKDVVVGPVKNNSRLVFLNNAKAAQIPCLQVAFTVIFVILTVVICTPSPSSPHPLLLILVGAVRTPIIAFEHERPTTPSRACTSPRQRCTTTGEHCPSPPLLEGHMKALRNVVSCVKQLETMLDTPGQSVADFGTNRRSMYGRQL